MGIWGVPFRAMNFINFVSQQVQNHASPGVLWHARLTTPPPLTIYSSQIAPKERAQDLTHQDYLTHQDSHVLLAKQALKQVGNSESHLSMIKEPPLSPPERDQDLLSYLVGNLQHHTRLIDGVFRATAFSLPFLLPRCWVPRQINGLFVTSRTKSHDMRGGVAYR